MLAFVLKSVHKKFTARTSVRPRLYTQCQHRRRVHRFSDLLLAARRRTVNDRIVNEAIMKRPRDHLAIMARAQRQPWLRSRPSYLNPTPHDIKGRDR